MKFKVQRMTVRTKPWPAADGRELTFAATPTAETLAAHEAVCRACPMFDRNYPDRCASPTHQGCCGGTGIITRPWAFLTACPHDKWRRS